MHVTDVISVMVEHLERLGWAPLGDLNPGLTVEELRGIASKYSFMDPDWIDEEAAAWWSWQNGVAGGELSGRRGWLTPDRLVRVSNFGDTLRDFSGLAEIGGEEEFAELLGESPTIPLCVLPNGDMVCIRQVAPIKGWGIWVLGDWEWSTLAADQEGMGNIGVPFVPYLHGFCDRLEGDRLVPSEIEPDNMVKKLPNGRPYTREEWFYPWH